MRNPPTLLGQPRAQLAPPLLLLLLLFGWPLPSIERVGRQSSNCGGQHEQNGRKLGALNSPPPPPPPSCSVASRVEARNRDETRWIVLSERTGRIFHSSSATCLPDILFGVVVVVVVGNSRRREFSYRQHRQAGCRPPGKAITKRLALKRSSSTQRNLAAFESRSRAARCGCRRAATNYKLQQPNGQFGPSKPGLLAEARLPPAFLSSHPSC